MTVDEELVEAIEASAITTIDDVVTLMRTIDGLVARNDGLKWFNLLYLRVTESLQTRPPGQGWENPQFLERMAVVFAGLYFTAAANWQRDRSRVPRSWRPLFMSRPRRGIVRVQFAIAGMNAHINHDLPIALVQASEDEGITPRGDSPEHRDFERVNTILQTVADHHVHRQDFPGQRIQQD